MRQSNDSLFLIMSSTVNYVAEFGGGGISAFYDPISGVGAFVEGNNLPNFQVPRLEVGSVGRRKRSAQRTHWRNAISRPRAFYNLSIRDKYITNSNIYKYR